MLVFDDRVVVCWQRGVCARIKNESPYCHNQTAAVAERLCGELRRDGFASLEPESEARGEITTRMLRYAGERWLFINAECRSEGSVSVEVRGADGRPWPNYSHSQCFHLSINSTRAHVRWQHVQTLPAGPVRLSFHLRDCQLFSFWAAASSNGSSNGFLGPPLPPLLPPWSIVWIFSSVFTTHFPD